MGHGSGVVWSFVLFLLVFFFFFFVEISTSRASARARVMIKNSIEDFCICDVTYKPARLRAALINPT